MSPPPKVTRPAGVASLAPRAPSPPRGLTPTPPSSVLSHQDTQAGASSPYDSLLSRSRAISDAKSWCSHPRLLSCAVLTPFMVPAIVMPCTEGSEGMGESCHDLPGMAHGKTTIHDVMRGAYLTAHCARAWSGLQMMPQAQRSRAWQQMSMV